MQSLEGLTYRVKNEGRQEETMRAVTVYRVDYGRKTKNPIGTVLEKRKRNGRTTTTTCCGWHGDSSR
jgi:hypothetical protein